MSSLLSFDSYTPARRHSQGPTRMFSFPIQPLIFWAKSLFLQTTFSHSQALKSCTWLFSYSEVLLPLLDFLYPMLHCISSPLGRPFLSHLGNKTSYWLPHLHVSSSPRLGSDTACPAAFSKKTLPKVLCSSTRVRPPFCVDHLSSCLGWTLTSSHPR